MKSACFLVVLFAFALPVFASEQINLYQDDWHGKLKHKVVKELYEQASLQLYDTLRDISKHCKDIPMEPNKTFFLKCIHPNAYPMISAMLDIYANTLGESDRVISHATSAWIRSGFNTEKADVGFDSVAFSDEVKNRKNTLIEWTYAFNLAIKQYPKLSQFSTHGGVDEKKVRFSVENSAINTSDMHSVFPLIIVKVLPALQKENALSLNSDAYIWASAAITLEKSCLQSKECYVYWVENKWAENLKLFLANYHAKHQ